MCSAGRSITHTGSAERARSRKSSACFDSGAAPCVGAPALSLIHDPDTGNISGRNFVRITFTQYKGAEASVVIFNIQNKRCLCAVIILQLFIVDGIVAALNRKGRKVFFAEDESRDAIVFVL